MNPTDSGDSPHFVSSVTIRFIFLFFSEISQQELDGFSLNIEQISGGSHPPFIDIPTKSNAL